MSVSVMLYTQQLSAMLKAGIPIDRALDFLAAGSDLRLNQVFRRCSRQVSSGRSFSEALRDHPRIFPPLYAALVESGEQSGTLIVVLEGLSDYLAKRLLYQRQIQAALAYPLALMGVCVGLLGVLMFFVIPALTPLFAQLGVPLPWLTRAVLGAADLLRQPNALLVMLMLALTMGVLLHQLWEADPQSSLRLWCDTQVLKVPVLGSLVALENSARLCSSLGLMLCSGLPLERALRAVAGVVGNRAMRVRVDQICNEILDGHDLSGAVVGLLPTLAVAMICNAEEVGRMGETLRHVGDLLGQDLEERIDTMTVLLEPLLLVLTSLIVGVVSVAALLPWISLLSQLG